MANVLIYTLVFPPDGVSTAQLMGELAVDLRAAGHSVRVLTTTPHYNRDTAAESRQPIRRAWGGLLGRSELQGIEVLHVAMPRKGGSVALRLLAWAWFHAVSVAIGVLGRPADVILTPSPPLTMGVGAWLIALLRGGCFVYNVQEVYPDLAIKTGTLRNRALIAALRRLERFVYDRAHTVTVISEGMRKNLLEKGVPAAKARLIPNFVDVGDIVPTPKRNAFAREHGLEAPFVVTYAGNMGPLQGLDALVDAAERLRGEPGIRFLFVGGGSERERLRARAARLGLGNVLFLEHQPYERVPEIYGASDLCVVPQLEGTGTDAAPSKVYRIMAAERPILALTTPGSDLARMVSAAGSGVVVSGADAAAVADAILAAYRDPRRAEAAAAGRRFVVERYSRARVTRQYADLVDEAGRAAGRPPAELLASKGTQ